MSATAQGLRMPRGAGTHLGRLIGTYLWLVPGISMMIFLFITPIALIFRDAIYDPAPSLKNFTALTADPLYIRVIWNSVRSALEATAGCLLIGYPTAYAIFRASSRWRQVVLGALLFSFAVGTVPRTFSWLVILGDKGLVNKLYFMLSGSSTAFFRLRNHLYLAIGMLNLVLF